MKTRWTGAWLVALAIAVHAPGLGQAFVMDDGLYIWKNPAVTGGAPFSAYFFDRDTSSNRPDFSSTLYRPLRTLAFRAVALVGGVRPIAFKLANLLLFALVPLLLLRLRLPAWAIAIWVVLPVHVESVTYASALGDHLSLVLELGALILAIEGRWLTSTLCLFAALLSKEMALTEPLLLVLLGWRYRRVAALHALAVVGFVALRARVIGALGQDPITLSATLQGVYEAPYLLLRYLQISLMPIGHAVSYRVVAPHWFAMVPIALVLGVAVWRSRGLAWFAIALLPVSHLVPVFADMADRYALVSSIGLVIALGQWRPRWLLVAPMIVLYAAGSLVEAGAWRNDAVLWRECVERQPEAPLGHRNLANVLLGQGRLEEAMTQLEALRALGWTRPDIELARVWIAWRLGRPIEARLDDSGPAHALLGLVALPDRELAAAELALAHDRAPSHPLVGLLGYRLQGIDDERTAYLEAMAAIGFDDAAGVAAAAQKCRLRPQCQALLGQALLLQGDLSARGHCDLAMAVLPPASLDYQHCRQALWGAQAK